ncbi:MAG: hypothetical protein ACHQ50_15560 [Fimbriimonadales bacterium]
MRLTVVTLLVAGLCGLAFGQAGKTGGDSKSSSESTYNQLYDTRTVTTFEGKVVGKEVAPPIKGMGNAVKLLVKTANGKTWHVEIGPEWFVSNQRTQIEVADSVRVTGSQVKIDGQDVILAEQIVEGKTVLALRRPSGRPYWDAVTVDDGTDQRSVRGEIVDIGSFVDATNGPTERLTIRTENGETVVALAPLWYLQHQPQALGLGEMVDVRNWSPVPQGGSGPVILGTQLRYGQQWILVRSPDGRQLWFGAVGN